MKPATIIAATARRFSFEVADLTGRARPPRLTLARHVAMWLVRQTGLSYPETGREFGRDHTTIMHACQKIDRLARENPDLADTIAAIRQELTRER